MGSGDGFYERAVDARGARDRWRGICGRDDQLAATLVTQRNRDVNVKR